MNRCFRRDEGDKGDSEVDCLSSPSPSSLSARLFHFANFKSWSIILSAVFP